MLWEKSVKVVFLRLVHVYAYTKILRTSQIFWSLHPETFNKRKKLWIKIKFYFYFCFALKIQEWTAFLLQCIMGNTPSGWKWKWMLMEILFEQIALSLMYLSAVLIFMHFLFFFPSYSILVFCTASFAGSQHHESSSINTALFFPAIWGTTAVPQWSQECDHFFFFSLGHLFSSLFWKMDHHV